MAKALHKRGLVAETTEVGAAVNCIHKQVLVVEENCIELGEVVVMVMAVAGKVQDGVMATAANALHKAVVMVEAAAVLYRVEAVVVVLYKVEEMVVVVNGPAEVESEQEAVGAVTDRDKLAATVRVVAAVVSVVVAVEVSVVVAVVDYSNIAQVVVGRIQDLVEVGVMVEAVKVVAETSHNKLVRVVAVKVAVVNRLAVVGMAEVATVAGVKVGVGVENRLEVAVKAGVVKVVVEEENRPVEVVEVAVAAVEANTLEVVAVASTLVAEAVASIPAVVAEGYEGHKQVTAVAVTAMVVTEEEEVAK